MITKPKFETRGQVKRRRYVFETRADTSSLFRSVHRSVDIVNGIAGGLLPCLIFFVARLTIEVGADCRRWKLLNRKKESVGHVSYSIITLICVMTFGGDGKEGLTNNDWITNRGFWNQNTYWFNSLQCWKLQSQTAFSFYIIVTCLFGRAFNLGVIFYENWH